MRSLHDDARRRPARRRHAGARLSARRPRSPTSPPRSRGSPTLARTRHDESGGRSISPAVMLVSDGRVAGYVRGPDDQQDRADPRRASTAADRSARPRPKKPGLSASPVRPQVKRVRARCSRSRSPRARRKHGARTTTPRSRRAVARDDARRADAWPELATVPAGRAGPRRRAARRRPTVPRFDVGGPVDRGRHRGRVVVAVRLRRRRLPPRPDRVDASRPGLHVAPPLARAGDFVLIGECVKPPEVAESAARLRARRHADRRRPQLRRDPRQQDVDDVRGRARPAATCGRADDHTLALAPRRRARSRSTSSPASRRRRTDDRAAARRPLQETAAWQIAHGDDGIIRATQKGKRRVADRALVHRAARRRVPARPGADGARVERRPRSAAHPR